LNPEFRKEIIPENKQSVMQLIIRDDPDKLFTEAAELFARAALEHEGSSFRVALSGGTTPKGLYSKISSEPFLSLMPWTKLDLWWVDERCISFDSPHSNFGNARKELLSHVPLSQAQFHPMPGNIEPLQGAAEYQDELIRAFGLRNAQVPVFDLIFLGVGADGHIASLFPGHKALYENKKLVVAIKVGESDLNRLSLTLPVLNQARQVVVLVSGGNKAGIIREIFESKNAEIPARMIRPVQGRLTWLVDREAAALLP
jgi:6-phosphogluconolactonase